MSIAALASCLGHCSATVTLNVDSHLMPDTEDRARAAIDAARAADVARALPKGAQNGR